MRSRWNTAGIAVALAILLAGPGCDLNNAGRDVPPARRNFPIAIAVAGPNLLVANSNYDLRYASGTLQSYEISVIDAILAAHECPGPDGRPCTITDLEMQPALLTDTDPPAQRGREVQVGSHMDGLALSSTGTRAYIPVRSGSGGLTWVTVGPSGLVCRSDPGTSTLPSCDARHRTAVDGGAAARGLTLPSDPVALAVGPVTDFTSDRNATGDYVVMAHRNGAVSLFLDPDPTDDTRAPMYVDTITGAPNDIVSIEADGHGLVWLTSGSLAAARQTRELVAVQVIQTLASGSFSASLAIARRATMRGVDDGLDSRDVVVDRSRDGRQPRIWVLSRRPESIITVDFALPPIALGEAPIGRIHPVGFGPSRLELLDLGGGAEPILVASCYDAHALFFVDQDLGPIATVAGMDGPFELAIDATARRAYVVDFRSSVLWVVDLAPLTSGGSPTLVARLGDIHAPSVFGR